jgi:hypothetical protein
MFNPSRDQARSFFFDTWEKSQRGETLSPLEQTALSVVLQHPEYQAILGDRQRNQSREYGPESGEMNPFLHLSLHLAVEEQLSIDQPPGIRARFERLASKLGSEHDAKHHVLECLGETVWQAQRTGTPPDQDAYLECISRKRG